MNTKLVTKKLFYSVFALALLTTTVGCPPPASPTSEDVDISTETVETEAFGTPGDNMTGTGNTTAVTEVPVGNEAP